MAEEAINIYRFPWPFISQLQLTTTVELRFVLLLLFLSPIATGTKHLSTCTTKTPPPLPVLPLPSFTQLQWQQREIIMFLHFGMNTFTDREWGTGHESPELFHPSSLNASQWVSAASAAGISLVILTAKHHDGFCLWPSAYTDHSVRQSSWRQGKGDVVGEFVDAARGAGVETGLYLSPWDRHDRRYGREIEYNEYYLAQLQELLAKYGSVREIWFDGAKGSNAPNMSYYFNDWFAMAKELQNSINVFSDAGPDVRWVGDETGHAGTTCWATINRTSLSIGNESIVKYLNTGDPKGTDWLPAECDVSIRRGWFWHRSEKPKKLSVLLDTYYNSVGHNCVLLLNVLPNTTGLISETDVNRLNEFKIALHVIFSKNLAKGCSIIANSVRGCEFGAENVLDDDHLWTYWAPVASGGSYWIEIRPPSGETKLPRFNVIRIQEAIGLGQRIKRHQVYVDSGRIVANGTTVGYKRLHRLLDPAMVDAKRVKIVILESRGLPLISSVGLHFDPYWYSTFSWRKGNLTEEKTKLPEK